jgi:glycosyltransferase involved in cell wall biosynthesis
MQQEQLHRTTDLIKSDVPGEPPIHYDMIVFCHLRWDFVYQRPQHIISRMSENLKILFVEEPIPFEAGEENTAELTEVNKNLFVLKPRVKSIAEIKKVLPIYVSNTTVKIGWFYSSAFVYLLNDIDFETVVYDCMDELTMFKGASELLSAQEIYLLSEADIVFTGGKSLYEAKKQTHDNVYCFPSSVDRKHFEQALNGISVPPDMPTGKPVVGYYGVIDERIDLHLLQSVAEKMPEVNFVMIGPVVKINETHLPKAANLYYPGMKPYKALPGYLKAFDIAMMPFALNDATRFISPTKTLEYMAAHKPIVSTPVYDVVRDYQDCVAVINNADECCNAIRNILRRPEEEKAKQQQQFEVILNNTSWDKTVNNMQQIIKNFAHE